MGGKPGGNQSLSLALTTYSSLIISIIKKIDSTTFGELTVSKRLVRTKTIEIYLTKNLSDSRKGTT